MFYNQGATLAVRPPVPLNGAKYNLFVEFIAMSVNCSERAIKTKPELIVLLQCAWDGLRMCPMAVRTGGTALCLTSDLLLAVCQIVCYCLRSCRLVLFPTSVQAAINRY